MPVNPNNAEAFLNQKWVKTAFLILGTILTLSALAQIFCLVFKPTGYERIVTMLGGKYWIQLFLGVLFLLSYFLMRKNGKNAK